MKLTNLSTLLFTVLLGTTPSLTAHATVSGKGLLTGDALNIAPGKKGTVILFMSAVCPCSNSHVEIVKKLADKFADFAFVGVHSNADETPQVSQSYFKTAAFAFPIIEDSKARLADEYKALKTPHAFVLSPEGKVLYRGGITSSTVGETADKQFLKDALEDVSAGRDVRVAEGRSLGCTISRGVKNVW